MTRIQKGSKFNLRNLLGKTREENDLGMKVLRYVMAVGFVLSPWLGGEAYAEGNGIVRAGTDKPNLIGYDGVANVANIYAEKAANGVGLNAFTHFELGNNQIANMYFKTSPTDANTLHTLVNTVENQISISGTVNAIRNNEVGGNLYFLSPNGMVVGAGGVINAGSLTMITSGKTFYDTKGALDPAAAAAAVSANNWTLDSTAPISIQGQINTAGGIDLRAVSISMSKSTTKGDVAPALKTGMVFEQVVNTQGLNTYKAKAEERLTAAEVNGEIKLYTKYDSANSENSGKIALSDGAVDAVGNVYIEADRAAAMVSADIDASGNIEIIANRNRSNGDDIGEVTLVNSDVYAGGNINIVADKSINLQSTIIQAGGTIDFASKWYQNDYSPYTHGGTLTVDGGSISANGYIYADAGKKIEIKNGGSITSDSELTIQCLANGGSSDYYSELVLTGGTVSGNEVKIDVDDKIVVNKGASIASTVKMNVNVEQGEIVNKGSIIGAGIVNLQSQHKDNTSNGNINNEGIIESTGGTLKLTANDNLTNTGTIQAKDQITFEVANTITNRGDIVSTYSNVQAHIGRDFYNLAKSDTKYGSGVSSAKDGRIIAGGNVQVDYPLERPASQNGTYGIYNSGLIQANGNSAPESEGGVVDKETGSGNIWLTSSYNITNYGNMIAGRQITLNARDFLDNYGLIQGVTYLDIKSIMGYVYNHGTDNNGNAMDQPGRIIATGGNIDLSSGQENLQIQGDTDGQLKELYRKFTPIIIEGLVKATSDDDTSNQTREGNINITAHLGDIYINGGTIKTKAEKSETGEVMAEAGDVILDAAQNITIGFKTEKLWADDPTTDEPDNREYYINTNETSQNAANISGTNIILTSGSGENTISMSEVNNTLTASKAITINTNSMDIVGGTFNANTLAASKNLNIVGGTINTNNITAGIIDGVNNGGQLTITGGAINVANVTANGALTLTGGTVGRTDSSLSIIGTGDVGIGSGAIVRTSSDVSIASDEGTVTNNSELNISGSVSLSGKTDVTNSANITAGKDVSMTATTGKVNNSKVVKASGGNINLTGGTSINLQEGYGLEASDTINLTTDNMQITSGTIKANTLAASEALTLTGGTINAANISAGTNLIHNGAIITADNDVTISAGNNINLQSGRLTANGAAFVVTNGTAGANSIVESASGYNLGVGSLSLSANQGNITLKGTDNVLQSVTLADVGGNVEIVNGNDTNKNVLIVSTAEGTTVGGTISIDNKGAGITVAGVNARDAVNLTAGESITVDGDVVAATASFGTGVDFIHNGGAIAAGEVVVTAGRDILLNSGSMEASTSASLTANAGSIAEQAGYAIDAPQVTLSAAKYADLDSTANQLVNVKVTKVGGDLTIGSGKKKNTDNLQVDVAQNVDGDLTLKNYSVAGDENANSIVVAGALSATKNITITNAEANINVGTDATVNAANISLEANSGAVNVTGNAVITTANTGTLTANANNIIIAGGQITAGTATITSNGTADGSGFTMSGGTITAGTANITSAKAINQTAGSIVAENTVATAGGNLSLASSANKLQNVTVTANKGSVTIVSGSDAEGALKVKTDGTIGGTLSINNVDDGVDNAIVIDNDLLANGNITITNQEADINLVAGSTITSENGDVTIGSASNVVSAGAINAGTLTASGFLNITGGAINVTNINANNALSIAGGTINAANVTATEALSVGDGSVTASKVTAKKTLSVTGGTINAANVAVTEAMSIAGGTIYTGTGEGTISAGSINISAGSVTGSDITIATTGNYEQTEGKIASDVATINAKNMTIKGGSITGKNVNISADEQVQLQKGSITVQNSNAGQLTIGAGNVLHNGAAITADKATINAVSGISLTSGSLTAQEAALTVTNSTSETSIVEGANYSMAVASLGVSANHGAITLNGSGNILQNVTLANAGGDITIVNGNDTTHKALNVSTAGTDKVQGAINITNNGADITVGGVNARDAVNLTTGENITVTGAVNASGATLQAAKGIDLTGSINTTGNASLTAGENIKVAGDVNAGNASFGAGVDFIHNSGAIAAGEVVVTAGQNVKLNGGSMVAGKSASLTAGTAGENLAEGQGFIAEQDGYAIDTPQLTASAAKYADLDSTANQLVNVNATQVGGNLTIGSGNTKSDVALQIATAGTIQGDLTVINYASNGDAKANEIIFGNNINATGNIVLNNQETDINIGQGLTITSVNEGVSITSAGNVNLAGTIDVKNVNITADEAISQTAGSIVATNTVATAGSDLSLARETNKLQNVTVKADEGTVTIVSGNDAEGALKVKTDGIIGGDLTITNVANGGVNNIVIDNDLLANGNIIIQNDEAGINLGTNVGITSNIGGISITALKDLISAGIINAVNDVILKAINNNLNMSGGSITATGGSIALHGKGGINNGASITAKGNVGLYSTGGSITNSAHIIAGHNFASATKRAALFSLRALAQETEETGSVTMSGKYGVANTASASVSAEQSVSMTSTAGSVNNSSEVTSNSGAVVISGQTGVTNTGAVTATGGSVEISGSSVSNTGAVNATGGSVTMSGSGGVTNDADINAKDSVTMTSEQGTVDNSNTVNAGTGTVTMSGKTGVVNDNASATISAGSGVSMTSSAESVTNSSTVTSTSGTVEMDGQKTVTNTGAVTATGGSVEISGNDGVTNSANITAGSDVSMNTNKGNIGNSGTIKANDDIAMTSTKGNIKSTNKVESLNGSISAATTYGEVNISEIIAGGTASVSSQSGSVIIGSVSGNDVVLSSGASSSGGSGDGGEGGSGGSETSYPSIKVGTAKVDNSLKLQGDDIAVKSVASSNTAGDNKLTVDVSGAGGADTAVQGSLELNVKGDVVFDNLNVTNASVEASGNIDVNKINVEGKGETTLVSNKTEGNENGTTVTVVGKDATPPEGSNVIVDNGNGWKIEMNEEGSKTTVVNDPGNNDYAVQMSAKLVDYDPYDTYLDHYADMADIFSRSYLIDAPERSSSDILFPAQGGRIVLKQDANGLHLEVANDWNEEETKKEA